MIRAHLATFPERLNILGDTVRCIAPQVDRIFICLNEISETPSVLKGFKNVEVLFPKSDLKDAGKFAFPVADDDIIFTIDDDIIYPKDYVANTLKFTEKLDLSTNAIGYQANAFVFKKQINRNGWRNFAFKKKCPQIIKVDVLGTGTACFMGKNCPSLDDILPCAGFVDLRFSRHQTNSNVTMWALPREDNYLVNNLPEDLWETSLFKKVNRRNPPEMRSETHLLLQERTPNSGLKFEKISKSRDG